MPIRLVATQGFDRLSPNGMGCVFGVAVFPITLSLSKGRLRTNERVFELKSVF
jgi:hypothetical protein